MWMNTFALLLPLLLWNLVSCAYPRSITEIITSAFINNLNARDLGQDFPVYEEPSERPEQKLLDESRLSLYSLPGETLSQVFEYMSHEDCDKFIELSKTCNFDANQWIRSRLTHFSPHFLFRSKRLNQLLAFELSRYFNIQTRISDADACDQYEMACLDGLNEYRGVPGYLVQSFIHESLYGSDSPIPTRLSHWKMMLYMKIANDKTRNYKKSLQRVIQIERKMINEEYDDPSYRMKLNNFLDLFVEFITSPSVNEDKLKEFLKRKGLIDLETKYLEADLVIKILFHEQLVPQEETFQVNEEVLMNGLSSKSLFDRATPTIESAIMLFDQRDLLANRMFLKYYHENLRNAQIPSYYNVYTRDPNDPITQETLLSLCFSNLIAVSSPSLINIDGILKSIRWKKGIGSLDCIRDQTSSKSYLAYTWGNNVTFDILFSESGGKAVNVFYRIVESLFKKPKIANVFNSNPTELKETKLRIYLKKLLKRADPLPLIFINPEWLFKVADLITDNFSLNKRYLFNINPHEFEGCTHLNNLTSRINQFLSFSEIIRELKVSGLMELFTTSESTIPEPDNHQRVISVAKYIELGSLD